MAKRNGTGYGSSNVQVSQSRLRPAVPKIGELATGLAAPSEPVVNAAASAAATALRETGDSAAASLLGSLGGLARAAKDRGLRVLEGLGLKGTPPEVLAPYLADAEAFSISEITRLSAEAGRGVCGPMPASMVQSAALELAGSRAAFAAGNVLLGSRLAAASRANLLSAFDLCCKQARERPATPADNPTPWFTTSDDPRALHSPAPPKEREP